MNILCVSSKLGFVAISKLPYYTSLLFRVIQMRRMLTATGRREWNVLMEAVQFGHRDVIGAVMRVLRDKLEPHEVKTPFLKGNIVLRLNMSNAAYTRVCHCSLLVLFFISHLNTTFLSISQNIFRRSSVVYHTFSPPEAQEQGRRHRGIHLDGVASLRMCTPVEPPNA